MATTAGNPALASRARVEWRASRLERPTYVMTTIGVAGIGLDSFAFNAGS